MIKLIAIGNAGRQDDGLGWVLAEMLEAQGLLPGDIHYRYQLQVEDASLIAGAERVIFVDAFRGDLPGGFVFRRLEPAGTFDFTTHALTPEAVLFVCAELYGKHPEASCLLVCGTSWELAAGLSEAAARNLRNAEQFLRVEVVCRHPPVGTCS